MLAILILAIIGLGIYYVTANKEEEVVKLDRDRWKHYHLPKR